MAEADLPAAIIPRVRQHVLSQLVCLGRHTVTSLLTTAGRQFHDWTAAYRMYSHARVDPDDLFRVARRAVAAAVAAHRPLVGALGRVSAASRGWVEIGTPVSTGFTRG